MSTATPVARRRRTSNPKSSTARRTRNPETREVLASRVAAATGGDVWTSPDGERVRVYVRKGRKDGYVEIVSPARLEYGTHRGGISEGDMYRPLVAAGIVATSNISEVLPGAAPPPSPVSVEAPKPEGFGVEERGKRKAGQLRMFNPAPRTARAAAPFGQLVVLGHLTEIVTRGPTGQASAWRWALRSAPLLAYDTDGRLFVVYPTRKTGRASAAATKSYARTHWGKAGKGNVLEGAIVVGKAKVLGVGVSVTYTTEKGADAAPVDYVHEWGEGAPARQTWTPPLVCHDDRGDRVAFAGGTYRVTERGIVG